MKKLMVLFSLFRKGSELADSEKWKSHQITSTMLGVFLLACVQAAKAFGYDLPINEETATAIGAGILGVVNVVLSIITSKRAGILPAAEQATDSLQQANAPAKEDVSGFLESAAGQAAIARAKAALAKDREQAAVNPDDFYK